MTVFYVKNDKLILFKKCEHKKVLYIFILIFIWLIGSHKLTDINDKIFFVMVLPVIGDYV